MCGIAGLFLKDRTLEPKLGAMLSEYAGHFDGSWSRLCWTSPSTVQRRKARRRSPFNPLSPARTSTALEGGSLTARRQR